MADGRGDYTPDSCLQSFLSAGAIQLVCPNTTLRMTAQHGDVLAFRATAPSEGEADASALLSGRSDSIGHEGTSPTRRGS